MAHSWSQDEIKTLVQLSSFINASLDIDRVMDNSLSVLEAFIDAEVSSIFEIDEERKELFFRVARGKAGNKLAMQSIKMGEGIAGITASTGEPLLVHDVGKDERFNHTLDRLTSYRTKSIIAAPIRNKGRTIGVIEVINKRGPDPFDTKDLEMLTIVANHLGIAIENAKLYADLNEKFCFTQSELKKSQEELVRSERMAALGQLAHGIAHAVRNPVMSIGGFTKRLQKKLSADTSANEYFDMILEETRRLEQLVKDVHTYTSLPKPDFRKINISEMLDTLLEDRKEQFISNNISVAYKRLSDDVEILADQYQMSDVIAHLLQNAIEAMHAGGSIVISLVLEERWLIISIKDSGRGIKPDHLPHIFDPFFTQKTHGSGLGLTTVNRIISDHNGEVEIASVRGKGTEVKVYLPLHSPENN